METKEIVNWLEKHMIPGSWKEVEANDVKFDVLLLAPYEDAQLISFSSSEFRAFLKKVKEANDQS